MFCKTCGAELAEGSDVCEACGIENTVTESTPIDDCGTTHNGYVSFGEAMKLFFANYFNFKGRASKSEYWWVLLFHIFFGFVAGLILTFVTVANEDVAFFLEIAIYLFIVALYIPNLSLQIRRLHDLGKAWFWIFWSFIPYVGSVIFLLLFLKDSDGDNQWGPGPVSNQKPLIIK